MKTTPNLLAGELMTIEKQFKRHGALSRMYSKHFYDKHFVAALGRYLMYAHKDVTVKQTDEDYILEMR